MQKIVVVDYGMGNLRSVAQAMRRAAPQAEVSIADQPEALLAADRLILPGQGGMPDCMGALRASGLEAALREAARNKPLLGVCVGEQMLFEHSAEGDSSCLGLLPGKVVRFALEDQLQADGSRFKVPQMGWNRVSQKNPHALWQGIPDNSYFYFVHSYYAVPEEAAHTVGVCEYGGWFACAVAHENLFATQFHPEKSAAAGLRLYENFANWRP